MKIGKTLRKLREKRDFTQEGLAHELGISQPAFSKIESSTNSISIEKLMRFCEVLNYDITKILVFEVEEHVENSNIIDKPMVDSMIALKNLYESRIRYLEKEVLFLRDELKSKRK